MPIDRAGNTFNQARTLDATGKSVVRDRIDRSDRTDFYTFTLNKSSNVNLKLNRLKGNLDLELFNADGGRISRSRNKKNKSERIKETLEAGTYYIKVKRKGGNSNYKLRSTFRDAPQSESIPPVNPQSTPGDGADFINEVLTLTNNERQKANLPALTLNRNLSRAAQIQSEDLGDNDFFAHTSPTGTTLADRLRSGGYNRYATAGENIAAGQLTAQQVVDEWMASPGHRANILDEDFTELGVGYYFLANDTGDVNYNHYWTQTFGRPMN